MAGQARLSQQSLDLPSLTAFPHPVQSHSAGPQQLVLVASQVPCGLAVSGQWAVGAHRLSGFLQTRRLERSSSRGLTTKGKRAESE